MVEIKYLSSCPQYASVLAGWSYDEWNRSRGLDPDILEKAYRARAQEDSIPLTFVAVEDAVPMGMVSIREDDLWSRKDLNPWLASLFVVPKFRRMGIGSRLIKRVIEKARELNICRIYIFLGNTEKGILENFYNKRGWQYFDDATDNDGKLTKILFYDL